jgi:hypothetical protein
MTEEPIWKMLEVSYFSKDGWKTITTQEELDAWVRGELR